MGRPTNTQERRTQIVSALQTVMAQVGYAHASTKRIAATAGLSAGLVHYHFRSKQAILAALIKRLVDGVGRRFQRRLDKANDPWDRIDAFLDAHLALGDDADTSAVACWVVLGAESLRQPEIRTLYAEAVMADLELLRSLLSAIDASRAPDAAVVLMATIQGAYQLAAITEVIPTGRAASLARHQARSLMGAG